MRKWYEPDQTWIAIGVKDKEDYVKHYVVEGRFHNDVHEDVVQAYRTAEYLMALSWYHYPMYDEALKKLLGILEIAVKLKCQQLRIPLEKVSAKGKKYIYRLEELIDKICELEPEKELNWQLHHGRKLRNTFAHPDRHSYMGGFIQLPFVPLINTLNLLFLNTATVSANKKYLASLKEDFSEFQKGAFMLESSDTGYLITKAEPLAAFLSNGEWYSCWFFDRVFKNVVEALSKPQSAEPLLITLAKLDKKDALLTGIDVQTGAEIILSPTDHPVNQAMFTEFEQGWRSLEVKNQIIYEMNLKSEISKGLGKLMYQYCWN